MEPPALQFDDFKLALVKTPGMAGLPPKTLPRATWTDHDTKEKRNCPLESLEVGPAPSDGGTPVLRIRHENGLVHRIDLAAEEREVVVRNLETWKKTKDVKALMALLPVEDLVSGPPIKKQPPPLAALLSNRPSTFRSFSKKSGGINLDFVMNAPRRALPPTPPVKKPPPPISEDQLPLSPAYKRPRNFVRDQDDAIENSPPNPTVAPAARPLIKTSTQAKRGASSVFSGFQDQPQYDLTISPPSTPPSSWRPSSRFSLTASTTTTPATRRLGLINNGNTCYVNATLQALVPLESLNSDMHSRYWDKQVSPLTTPLFCQLRELLCKLQQPEGGDARSTAPMTTQAFRHLLPSQFRQGRQEDVHEFLVKVLDLVEGELQAMWQGAFQAQARDLWPELFTNPSWHPFEALSPLRSLSSVVNVEMTCAGCGDQRAHAEKFLVHSLDFADSAPSNLTLDELLGQHFCLETRKLVCEKCAFEQVETLTRLSELPQLLCLHVKRFGRENEVTRKRTDWLSVPLELDLTKFATEDATCPRKSSWPILGKRSADEELDRAVWASRKAPIKWVYNLSSAVHHHGSSMSSGHYTAVTRAEGGAWIEFDDAFTKDVGNTWREDARFATTCMLLFYELVNGGGQ